MDNLILYSDSKENLKYNLSIMGCTLTDTTTKLCLEFNNGYNLYFNGNIDGNGDCVVDIDELKDFEGKGHAKIEVVAENTLFVIHEMPFEVKKKIDVKVNENSENGFELEVKDKEVLVDIKFQEEKIEENVQEQVEEKIEEQVEEQVEEKIEEQFEEKIEEKIEENVQEDKQILGKNEEEEHLDIVRYSDFFKK